MHMRSIACIIVMSAGAIMARGQAVLVRDVVSGGSVIGAVSTAGRVLSGTIGQPVVGLTTAAPPFGGLYQGFWAPLDAALVSVDDAASADEGDIAMPNPFATSTRVRMQRKPNADLTVRIVDVLGATVRTMHVRTDDAGHVDVVWNGRTDADTPAGAGTYLLHAESADGQRRRPTPITLVR
jgi:hypothetical protein